MKQSIKGHILLIDSGVGGLGVLTHIKKLLPDVDYSYVADEAYFPYGELSNAVLCERVAQIIKVIEKKGGIDCVVVACNTASTSVLEHLREQFNFPIVGVVPAIKVAVEKTQIKRFGVLATEATAKGVYIAGLIEQFAGGCEVVLHGAKGLARLAEQKLNGNKVLIADVEREIQGVFANGLIDCVVLGCTHYPHLLDELRLAAPYAVEWVDPAGAVARRVVKVFVASNNANLGENYYTTGENSGYKVRAFEYLECDA